jgi:hypothetical protein
MALGEIDLLLLPLPPLTIPIIEFTKPKNTFFYLHRTHIHLTESNK